VNTHIADLERADVAAPHAIELKLELVVIVPASLDVAHIASLRALTFEPFRSR
jgi:hypothetical protein